MTEQTFLERYKELMFLYENPDEIIDKDAFDKELAEADEKIEKAIKVIEKIDAKKQTLTEFLKELEEAKTITEAKGGIQISGMAGLFERAELTALEEITNGN